MKRTWVLILGVMVLAGMSKPAYSADFVKSIQPFFAKNCYSCHSAKLKTGGLNLEAYVNPASIAEDPERFEKILQRLKAGEMPPKTMPRPDAEAQNSGLTTQGSKSR